MIKVITINKTNYFAVQRSLLMKATPAAYADGKTPMKNAISINI